MGRKYNPSVLKEEIEPFKRSIAHFKESLSLEIDDNGIVFFTSPLRRCWETANLLRNELSVSTSIKICEAFNETDYGDFSGKTIAQIQQKYSQLYKTWIQKPSKQLFPNGESYVQVQKRAVEKLDEISRLFQGKSVFVVTHVDVIKMILCSVLAISIDKKAFFKIDPGSFSGLDVYRGQRRVVFTNFQ